MDIWYYETINFAKRPCPSLSSSKPQSKNGHLSKPEGQGQKIQNIHKLNKKEKTLTMNQLFQHFNPNKKETTNENV